MKMYIIAILNKISSYIHDVRMLVYELKRPHGPPKKRIDIKYIEDYIERKKSGKSEFWKSKDVN